MDKIVIDCKRAEYFSRSHLAFHLGNREKTRKLALTALVIYRLDARLAHGNVESIRAEIRELKRSVKKMDAGGVRIPFCEMRIKTLEEELDAADKKLAGVGEEIYYMLELWQAAGATFEDLCNLCNRDPAQVKKELEGEPTDGSLADLAMICYLDYKDPRNADWVKDSVDAPITHALKAYLLDGVLHTEAGRKAAHEAMDAVIRGADKKT